MQRFEKARDKFLEPDEQLISGGTSQYSGHFKKSVAGGGFGLIGFAIANKMVNQDQDGVTAASIAAQWPEAQINLALTDRRILGAKMGTKVKDIVLDMPRDQIASMDFVKKSLASKLTVRFVDGSHVELEGFAQELSAHFPDSASVRPAGEMPPPPGGSMPSMPPAPMFDSPPPPAPVATGHQPPPPR